MYRFIASRDRGARRTSSTWTWVEGVGESNHRRTLSRSRSGTRSNPSIQQYRCDHGSSRDDASCRIYSYHRRFEGEPLLRFRFSCQSYRWPISPLISQTATLHTDDPNVLHPLYYEYIPHTNRFFLVTAPARFQELFFANDETLYDVHEVPEPGHAVGTSHRVTGRNLLHEQRSLANYVEHQHSIGRHLESKVSRGKGAFFAQSRRIWSSVTWWSFVRISLWYIYFASFVPCLCNALEFVLSSTTEK